MHEQTIENLLDLIFCHLEKIWLLRWSIFNYPFGTIITWWLVFLTETWKTIMQHELFRKVKLLLGKQVIDPGVLHLKEACRNLLASASCDFTVVQLFESQITELV